MKKLKIVFLTGTRADYGKLKSLTRACDGDRDIDAYVYISGMHLFAEYGSTYKEVVADGYSNVFMPDDFAFSSDMDILLANTITAFSKYVRRVAPDLIVVHGDRVEPLAGAIVGALNNIKVAHIEGGEVTGTADEFMRHAITKLATLHFVSNEEARLRLIQLGERDRDIHVFGSPDIDIMLSDKLPALGEVKRRYNISFDKYAIFCYHPVTTSGSLAEDIAQAVEAVKESGLNYIVIYPNNDLGSDIIRNALEKLRESPKLQMFKSLPFEDFLALLKHCDFIIGNSSAGVREACVYGVPAIDLGTRQNGRYNFAALPNIQHARENKPDISRAITLADSHRFVSRYFGDGHSAEIFLRIVKNPAMLRAEFQKTFVPMSQTQAAIENYINEVCF
jgi:UDP-N-acetylglucosamine 2-epimerase (hydrolysing)